MSSRARLAGLLALAASAVTFGAPVAIAAGPPQVNEAWVAEVKASSVDVRGLIDPGELLTIARAEYIAEAAYQANLAAIPPRDGFFGALKTSPVSIGSNSTEQPYLQHVGALKATTAYRYRIVASNESGATLGLDRTFTTTESAPVFSLPDGRGWELVSPVDKNGGAVAGFGALFGGGVLQGAADGNSATFSSRSSFGPAQGAPGASQYLARRGGGGWSTENITPPTLSGAYGDQPDGVPYQLLSGDLARGLLIDGRRCEEAQPCPRSYSLRESAGAILAQSPEALDLAFAGANPGLTHVVLSTCAALTPDATEVAGVGGSCDLAKPNLYLWSTSGLELINLLPGASQGTPGAELAAQGGAVSTDGSRVYWMDEASGNLYLREGNQTTQVDASTGGGGAFQTATPDGSVAFFTKAGHLYRYTVPAKATTDLTPGGEVQGVLGASENGSYLYYLTAGGLFLSHGVTTSPVAADADATNYPPTTGTARVSAGGTHLAFLSAASLTGYDNHGETEVFLYGPASAGGPASLTCASCNPSGARPLGPSSIPGAIANGKAPTATRLHRPRALSADAARLFFDSADALVPLDTNGDTDVYQWEAQGTGSCQKAGGCISLISSGQSAEGASFVDASADGSDVFFLTRGSLVQGDPGSADIYDARVGGGFPEPGPPIPCVGDACQSLPGVPEDPTPSTLFIRPGGGNPPPSFPKPKPKKPHHKGKHHNKKKHHKGKHNKRGGSK